LLVTILCSAAIYVTMHTQKHKPLAVSTAVQSANSTVATAANVVAAAVLLLLLH
jgi:hypothetical protein